MLQFLHFTEEDGFARWITGQNQNLMQPGLISVTAEPLLYLEDDDYGGEEGEERKGVESLSVVKV